MKVNKVKPPMLTRIKLNYTFDVLTVSIVETLNFSTLKGFVLKIENRQIN
jgi:hypothetical protein